VPGASADSPADWPERVGSVAYEGADAFVFVDPLVPEELWPALEERVRAHGRPVRVLTTIGFHRRSRDEVVRRFDATTSRAKPSLPEGVETVIIRRAGETMVWLRALGLSSRAIGSSGTIMGPSACAPRAGSATWSRA